MLFEFLQKFVGYQIQNVQVRNLGSINPERDLGGEVVDFLRRVWPPQNPKNLIASSD